MMGIDRFNAAYLATLFVEIAGLDGPLYSEMCFILATVGTARVHLPGVGLEHLRGPLRGEKSQSAPRGFPVKNHRY